MPNSPKATRKASGSKSDEKQWLSPHWRSRFLEHLAETSNVSESARRIDIDPSRVYRARREEPDFARQWRSALCDGYELLELELLGRFRSGEAKDGPRFDNANALRLLSLHRESVSQEQAQRRNMDEKTAREIIEAKLEELRQRVLARREAQRLAEQENQIGQG